MKATLLLENIRSIHNVGAFFRTADGAGFDHIFLCGFTPTPEDPRMKKVALGAEEMISWSQHESTLDLCDDLRSQGFSLYALETGEDSKNLFQAQLSQKPFTLLFGHEVEGVSDSLLEKADQTFFLPMRGQKESLNVSVAGGVAMYEVMRQMGKD